MRFLERDIDAVIFDMDGVLLDSEPLHFLAVNSILADEGASIDYEFYCRYIGTTLEHTWSDLSRHCSLKRPYEHYVRRYDEEIVEVYRTQSVASPGARELLDTLQAAGVRLALASSSNRLWVDTCLDCLGFSAYFEAAVAGDEVSRGKPDPEIYLATAARLAVEPSACLVVEDAPLGVVAAKAAGMLAVAVDTEYTRDLPIPEADLRVRNLQDLQQQIMPALTTATRAGVR
jgi:HAD superfamily hydrolase (TIGR01509 family)